MNEAWTSDDWLTPPKVLKSLGVFDLDPCVSTPMPWQIASEQFTKTDDGLSREWRGRVWLNPPYSKLGGKSQLPLWLSKIVNHGAGIALVNVAVEREWFFDYIWKSAVAVFFFKGRLRFLRPDGTLGSQGFSSSVLAAYSHSDASAIYNSGLEGKFIPLVIKLTEEVNTSWRRLIRFFIREMGGVATLDQLYALVAGHPKTSANHNWKAKVRQQVQKECKRVGPALWQSDLGFPA